MPILDADPVGRRFSEGFHARLKPLRAFGSWPGLPRDLPSTSARCPTRARSWSSPSGGSASPRRSGFCGRAGRPRRRRRTTGLVWSSAATRPPFVATVSIWESTRRARPPLRVRAAAAGSPQH